jgi:hypothetical protein
MKSGSIVVCIHDFSDITEEFPGKPYPLKEKEYTVDEVLMSEGDLWITLCEIKIFIDEDEIAFMAIKFREVEKAPDLAAEIEELIKEPITIQP